MYSSRFSSFVMHAVRYRFVQLLEHNDNHLSFIRKRLLCASILLITITGTVGADEPIQQFELSDTRRSTDTIDIIGDLRNVFRFSDQTLSKKWWERMMLGEVGKDRFLVLCALKDGKWKTLEDIRNFVEFQIRKTFSAEKLFKLHLTMGTAGIASHDNRTSRTLKFGEGWLERNPNSTPIGLASKWRISPSVLPLLHFLLMGCPEENSCD